MGSKKVELHLIFKGKVQGVGFRWTVQQHAESYGLTGTVRNLPDESVEVFAHGEEEILHAFLQKVQEDPGFATITALKISFSKIKSPYQGFCIL